MLLKEVTEFFGENSPLMNADQLDKAFHYEPRPQQVTMAIEIARAMDDEENLCVEAPTGVGKTFAYLVPAVLRAKQTSKPVIISTHTINLQEQIISHDVPMLEGLLKCKIQAVVAKGRANYLCLRRLNNILNTDQELLMFDGVAGEYARLQKWASNTLSGDRGELPHGISPQLWKTVCCERGNCMGKNCEYHQKCFLRKARRLVQTAEIVIANHAKFFSSLAAEREAMMLRNKNSGKKEEEADTILPEYTAVIMDEGHTIEDTASSHLGIATDSFSIRYLLNRLYNPDRKTGLLIEDDYTLARSVVTETRKICDIFFQQLYEWVDKQELNPLRYNTPGHIKNYLKEPLEKLLQVLASLVMDGDESDFATELSGIVTELNEQVRVLDTFFEMSEPDYVYWFELDSSRNRLDVSLSAVPIDVAPPLTELLFQKKPVIVTSATLAVNNDISYFQRRIGCTDARTLILDTPFDYQKQVTLQIATNMPEPKNRNAYIDEAIAHISESLRETDGRAFVLFTSYSMMNEIAERMEDFFKDEQMNLLIQGEKLSPRRMLEEFRNTPRSVIFGNASFWTGVDVPGDALCNVIITRLPFAVPDHPLVAARSERMEQQGLNAFFNYSVPEAVLKFRQGFGRLIRTKNDKGTVLILDSRVVNKRYGQTFLDSIPQCPRIYF